MKILCPIAGVGSELHTFVISKPKAMIKIAGKRIIDHGLELLQKYFPQGTSLIFIIGYKKEIIRPYLEKNYQDYFDLHFVEQKPLGIKGEIPYFSGIGDAISLAAPLARDDDCFIFFSDRLPTEDFSSFLAQLNQNEVDGVINVHEVDNPQHYGVCVLNDEGKITQVVEKPLTKLSNLAITWGYLISKTIINDMFDLLEVQAKNPPQVNTSNNLTTIIQQLIDQGARFEPHIMESPILDFGRIEDFLAGNQYLLTHPKLNSAIDATNNKTIKTPNKIKNSTIIPPVFIGENCRIENSVIGPNVSIGKGSELCECIISNAVVGNKCTLERIITQKSLIGDYVTLEELIKPQLSIGDTSSLASLDFLQST